VLPRRYAYVPSAPPMLKRLVRTPSLQAGLIRLAGAYARIAFATTRWRIVGAEHLAPHIRGEPVIVAFWHERQALMPMLWVLARRQGAEARVHVLSSRHHDGRFMSELVQRFRMHTVYGSTSRGGAASLRSLLALLAAGDHVAITPDGPRGPHRQAAPGVAQLAALAGVRVLPCAAQSSHRFQLRTWDRMVVPMPFGRGVIVCEPAITVGAEAWKDALPVIAAAMTAAAETADRLCAA
jgi:lysophospholipid acyltransferase (LPLAT)-like uncharacterized protein